MDADPGSSDSPLVSVSFQRNDQRKQKYLESEPKALGITQIGMSLFQSSCLGIFLYKGMGRTGLEIPFLISSLLILIAGSVAVAAKNLHLPTLKACLGMEIVASVASVFNLIMSLVLMNDFPFYCYRHYYYQENITDSFRELCRNIESAHMHLFAELVVVQAALLSISVTLAAYACKVVNCCSPAQKMPVITIQASPAPQ